MIFTVDRRRHSRVAAAITNFIERFKRVSTPVLTHALQMLAGGGKRGQSQLRLEFLGQLYHAGWFSYRH